MRGIKGNSEKTCKWPDPSIPNHARHIKIFCVAYYEWETLDALLITYFSGYRIECSWSGGADEYNISASETELRIPDLQPSTTYKYRIQAINERGSSPLSGN